MSIQIIGPQDSDYNCIAWAAGDTKHWWWPNYSAVKTHLAPIGSFIWPTKEPEIKISEDPKNFQRMFRQLGYKVIKNPNRAQLVFFHHGNLITHAARKVGKKWTSKIGSSQLIEHDLEDITESYSESYGEICFFMGLKK